MSANTNLFDITIDPFKYKDLENADFDQTEILPVFPVYDGDNTG